MLVISGNPASGLVKPAISSASSRACACVRATDDRRQPREDAQRRRVTPERPCALLHRRDEGTRGGEVVLRREDQLGEAGGEPHARLRGAGLHEHRVALRRARDVERSEHREVLALVRDPVDPAGVEIEAGLRVGDDRLRIPAVPQLEHDLDELLRDPVARVVLGVRPRAEVRRGGRDHRGDDVPTGPAVADVIERRELAGDRVRVVVGGRGGADQPDPLRAAGQAREQRHGVEPLLHVVLGRRPEGEEISDEDRIELPRLGDRGKPSEVVELVRGRRIGSRRAPRRERAPDPDSGRQQAHLVGPTHHPGAS